MGPEVVRPTVFQRRVDEEILHLGKSEESRSVNDVDAEDFSKTVVI